MRWSNKIQDKRAAYDLIERERPFKTLDELAKNLNVTRQRVSQMCRELNIKVRHNKWHQVKSNSLRNETSSVITTLTI